MQGAMPRCFLPGAGHVVSAGAEPPGFGQHLLGAGLLRLRGGKPRDMSRKGTPLVDEIGPRYRSTVSPAAVGAEDLLDVQIF